MFHKLLQDHSHKLQRFFLDVGWIRLVQIEANPTDNKKRICRRVLEILESGKISNSTQFLYSSIPMLRSTYQHLIFQSIISFFLQRELLTSLDHEVIVSLGFSFWMEGVYDCNKNIGLSLFVQEYLKESTILDLPIISDNAISRGYCESPPDYPGCWAIRKSIEDM